MLARRGAHLAAPFLLPLPLIALSLLVSACGATEPTAERPPVATPRSTASVRHAPGSPLSGGTRLDAPGVSADAVTPAGSLQVVVAFVALERMPESLLDPLTAHARLVASQGGGRALLPEAKLLAGARAGLVPDAESFVASLEGRANRFADLRGALPRGVTATFELACDHSCGARGESLRDLVALHVFRRPDGALDFAVELSLADTGDELAALDVRALSLGQGVATILPSPFAGDEARAIAAVAIVLPPPSDDAPGAAAHRLACAQCAADLAREAVFARERTEIPACATPPRPDLGTACRALAGPSSQRAALFALAQATGAPLAEDLALSIDDKVLASISAAVARDVTAPGAPSEGPALGWLVERAALLGLRNLAGQGDDVPPQVEEALVRRGGAVGRSLGTFFGLVEQSASLAELEQRLRAENRDLLEDGSPAIRARAFAWLSARGLCPAGYDPLGPSEARRAALDKASALEDSKRGGP